jgi:elongation factor Ts
MECKLALQASKGDLDEAANSLRIKGFAEVAKRANRATNQGLIESYIHTGGRVGAMVEMGCETDFVARTLEFKELAHDIAMQVAAMSPEYLDKSEIEEGDSRPVAQVSLLQQPFIKDNSSSVGDVIQELAAKLGENLRVLRFTRLALGE